MPPLFRLTSALECGARTWRWGAQPDDSNNNNNDDDINDDNSSLDPVLNVSFERMTAYPCTFGTLSAALLIVALNVAPLRAPKILAGNLHTRGFPIGWQEQIYWTETRPGEIIMS